MADSWLIVWYIRTAAVNFHCYRSAVQYHFETNILSWRFDYV